MKYGKIRKQNYQVALSNRTDTIYWLSKQALISVEMLSIFLTQHKDDVTLVV